jgi:hypothetical protein
MTTELATNEGVPSILANRPFGFERTQFWTSLDLHDPEQAVHLLKIRQKGDKEAKDCVNLPVELTHILRRWGEQTDNDSGEVRLYLGTTFLTKNGDTISSGSIGLERDLESLFALGLIPPWKPPLKVTFTFSKTSKGHDMLKMDFDLDDIKKRLKAMVKR